MHWPEIEEALRSEPGQKPPDRADITSRVFHMKLQEYIEDIRSGEAYGPVTACENYRFLIVSSLSVYQILATLLFLSLPVVADTIEFQKRGLPHAHILIWQTDCNREPSAAFVDQFISAELPDPNEDPLGFVLVQEFMMHGPCGDLDPKCPCMKDGKCSKRFPKTFQEHTTFDSDGFPIYRRRDTGVKARKGGVDLDNRWVVPHNLQILKKFQAHINVEACNQSYLIKYLFKYCNKGAVAARLGVAADTSVPMDTNAGSSEGVDEIAEYIKSRYLSWCEAVWRLLGFEIHEKFPAVERLHVHLPGMNMVAVSEEDDLEDVVNDPDSSKSTLSEWFVANQRFTAARQYTYCEFPNYYTWNNKEKAWEGRRRGTKIGRLRFIHPGVGDAFYLRMLLMVVRGATSYTDVRTYEDIVYNTF